MGLYAVSTVKDSDKIIKLVVLDSDREIAATMNVEEVVQRIKEGFVIDNIGLGSKGIEWKHGAESRYTSINIRTGETENVDNITVLYGISKKDGTVYVVSNYRGDMVCISEDKLIQYGNKYTLTNCKIVKRGDKTYIASIRGELKIIEDKAIVMFGDMDKRVLTEAPFNATSLLVDVPFGIDRLVIPSTLNGKDITLLSSVKTANKAGADRLKHLIVESGVKAITSNTFINLTSIEVAEYMGDISIYGEPFGDSSNIRKSYMKSLILHGSGGVFSGLRNLTEVKMGTMPISHVPLMFRDCNKLDVQSFICEGLLSIDSFAYANCKQLVDVKLPTTLVKLSKSAFSGCDNLRSITITNRNLYIEDDSYNHGLIEKYSNGIKGESLADIPDKVVIRYPYSFPKSDLRRLVSDNQRLVRLEPTEEELREEERYEKKVPKYNMLGIRTRKYDTARDTQEMIGALSIMTDDNWRKGILKIIKDNITIGPTVLGRSRLTCDCVSINIVMRTDTSNSDVSSSVYRREVPSLFIGERYACLWSSVCTRIIILDKEDMKGMLKRQLESDYIISVRKADEYNSAGLLIPTKVLTNIHNIESVEESNNTLTITHDNGKTTKIARR